MGKPVRGPLNVTGRDRGEVFSGTDFGDYINGAGGDDRIYGYGGNDTLIGGSGNDFIQANQGDDSVAGGSGSDTVRGSTGTDSLWGGNQYDAAGLFNMGPDGSADYFVFDYAADSSDKVGSGVDTIWDFHPEEGDVINVGATVEGYSYNQSYYWELVSDPAQLTHSYQQMTLTYDPASNTTTLKMYFGDHDPDADMTLYIKGQHTTDYGFLHIVG